MSDSHGHDSLGHDSLGHDSLGHDAVESDFFDRLLARSLPGYPTAEHETAVRPRLPQLFENPAVDDFALEVEEQVTAVARPAPVTARPAVPPAAAAVDGSPTQAVRFETPAPAWRGEPPSPRPAGGGDPPVHHAAPAPGPAMPGQPAPATAVTEQHTTVNVTPAAAQPVGTLLPAVTHSVVPPAADAGRPRPRTGPSRRGESQRPQHVVRVTIGRLEVTAATPGRQPGPGAKPSRSEPDMNLTRYLARQDGSR